MPPEVFEILREVVEALVQGLAITIAPHQMMWSTIEAGEIPFEKPHAASSRICCRWGERGVSPPDMGQQIRHVLSGIYADRASDKDALP